MEQNEILSINKTISPIKAFASPLKNRENQELFERLQVILKTLIACNFKWEAAQNRGSLICSSIEAIKLKAINDSNRSVSDFNLYPENLQDFCDKLAIILAICEDVVTTYEFLLKQIRNLVRLYKESTEIFCKTWSLNNFAETIEKIYQLCNKELEIKQKITAEIAHCNKREDLFFQSKLWKYPKYADEDLKFLILFIKQEVKDIIKIE